MSSVMPAEYTRPMSIPGTKNKPLPSDGITRTSNARPNMAPAAVKCPFKAAIVGTFRVRILESRSSASVWILVDSATFAVMYCKSIPLQKNLPSPATTTACTSAFSAASKAALTWLSNKGLMRCSNTRVPQGKFPSGPSIVTTATPSTISVFNNSIDVPDEKVRLFRVAYTFVAAFAGKNLPLLPTAVRGAGIAAEQVRRARSRNIGKQQ
mmetsp:Transcript_75839/g.190813  ORF Transcript_75839/g.190813 Transcript_75839/m.190813 type:complete len:210 (+) Transcript_75839:571-1200(+)